MNKKILIVLNMLFFLAILPLTARAEVYFQRVHLKAVGDIMVHDVQYRSVYDWTNRVYNFNPMFSEVKEYLKADLLVGNLETTLAGEKLGYSSYPRFNSPDEIIETLKNLGFDVLFTANNHTLDKGEYGLKRTLDVLDKYKIKHTGTFRSNKERKNFVKYNVGNITFGFLNYTYGTNGLSLKNNNDCFVNYLDEEKILEDIDELKQQVDMVIVGLHFGLEYKREPTLEQKELAEKLARAGADIILGSHPHVLEKYETLQIDDREVLVVYSLGNFVSGQKDRYTDSGAIMDIVVERKVYEKKPKIVKIDYTPVWVRRYHENGRLKMEVVPFTQKMLSEGKLNLQEKEKLKLAQKDAAEIWQKYYEDMFDYFALPLLESINLCFNAPSKLLPQLVKSFY